MANCITATMTVASGATTSSALHVENGATGLGFRFPDITAGAVTLEASFDNGTTYNPVLLADGVGLTDYTVLGLNQDPCVVYLPTEMVFALRNAKIRFVMAVQGAEATINVKQTLG